MSSKKKNNTKNIGPTNIESIIHEFNEEDADKIRDFSSQKVFYVNKKTGKVLSNFITAVLPDSFISVFKDSFSPFLPKAASSQIPDGHYIVSNSNFVHQSTHISDPIPFQDKYEKMDLEIRCEISCPSGNEEKVAKELLASGNKPKDNLNLKLKKWVYEFQKSNNFSISNFDESNLSRQIEKYIIAQKDPIDRQSHITGLFFHSVTCVQINKSEEVISIHTEIKVGFKNSIKFHKIELKCNLQISQDYNKDSHWRNVSKEDFEEIISKKVKKTYYQSISESDSFNRPEYIEYKLKDELNKSLAPNNRKINNLEVKDLYIETLRPKSSFEIKPERKDYLTADREKISLKVLISIKVTDLYELDSYGKNIHQMKNKVTEIANIAIKNFIASIDSSTFYYKIETNKDFKKSFVKVIRKKINKLITAKVKVRNVNYGDTHKVEKTWTKFEAHIKSRDETDEKKCIVTGSFIVTKDNLKVTHIRKGQVFGVDDIEKKIIETIEASLDRYYPHQLAEMYFEKPKKFETALGDLLETATSEAFGVIIKLQNIKAKLIGKSNLDIYIGKRIEELDVRIVDLITNGAPEEKVNRLREKRARLIEHQRETNSLLLDGKKTSEKSFILPDSEASSS